MRDEPRRHRGYLLLLALTCLNTIPWPFAGRAPVILAGLPDWLWWSGGWTVALSVVTAWGILRYWRDDELE